MPCTSRLIHEVMGIIHQPQKANAGKLVLLISLNLTSKYQAVASSSLTEGPYFLGSLHILWPSPTIKVYEHQVHIEWSGQFVMQNVVSLASQTYVKRLTRPQCNYTFGIKQSKLGFSKNEKRKIAIVRVEEFSVEGVINPTSLSNIGFIYLLQRYITLVQVTDGCLQLLFLIPWWPASIKSDRFHVASWGEKKKP